VEWFGVRVVGRGHSGCSNGPQLSTPFHNDDDDDDDDDDDKFNICLSYLCKNLSTHTEIKKTNQKIKADLMMTENDVTCFSYQPFAYSVNLAVSLVFKFIFAAAMLCISATYTVMRCLSVYVCLSVCHVRELLQNE